MEMITVEQATELIFKTVKDFGIEEVPLAQATSRVLRENFYADRDFPPYDRVTMDGIAIHFDAFQNGTRTFQIEGIAPAGTALMTLQNQENCLEVMTGSILPDNTDTVIRYEDLQIENGTATIQLDELTCGKNVHKKGNDRLQNDLIVSEGKIISPAEVGVAATVGKTHLKVSRLPKVAIISTGDELVEVNETPLPHQIRKSNVHTIKAALARFGIVADLFHLLDDREEILESLKSVLEVYDSLILSGGVSKGKFDYLPEALETLSVTKHFHKVKQRPGKPFWFGQTVDGTAVFALPGNPVSSFMCTQTYFVPWLKACLQIPFRNTPNAVLQRDFSFKPDLVYFLQVKIDYDSEGRILATPLEGHGSGDLANLVDADAFLRLPRSKDLFEKGEIFPVYFYR